MLDNWQTVAKALESHLRFILLTSEISWSHRMLPIIITRYWRLILKEFSSSRIFKRHFIWAFHGGKRHAVYSWFSGLRWKLMWWIWGSNAIPAGTTVFLMRWNSILPQWAAVSEAEEMLGKQIPNRGQFILKHDTHTWGENMEWKFNWPALYNNYQSGILAPVVFQHPVETPSHYLSAVSDPIIFPTATGRIFINYFQRTTRYGKNAGHWVHADQPQALIDLVVNFLSALIWQLPARN